MSTIIKNLIVSDTEPQATNLAWIKPVNNSFELRIFRNGQWVKDDNDNLEVTNITTIPSDVIELLKPGDLIIKVTGDAKHRYHVSYKGTSGICLTYVDAENVETVAYEKGASGWAYLDTTITNIAKDLVGSIQDDKNANTIYGAKAYAKDQADTLMGTEYDTSADMTLYGLKAYIDEKTS